MSKVLPVISIKCLKWDIEVSLRIEGFLTTIVERAIEINIFPRTVKEIIVTDEYEQEYMRIAREFGLISSLVNESEYQSVAKMCFNRKINSTECILLLHAKMFSNEDFVDAINTMFLTTIASDLLPEELKTDKLYYCDTPVSSIATIFFAGLFELLYAQVRMPVENRENLQPPISTKNIIAPFRRKVKRLHLKHQADNEFEYCVVHYYSAVQNLLRRFTQIFLYKIDFSEFNEFEPLLTFFGRNILIQFSNIINQEPYSLDFLKETIIGISELCFFEIKEFPYSIRVRENPKKLFPDLIDTHQRIVAFVDILGFSNFIQHFDENDNIQLLTDIKESLDVAIEKMNSSFKHSEGEIETRLFSDCLCISVPFFDNDTDFPFQFGAIMLGLKTYQSLLLVKGYLVRGGVTIGSYYSDANMIFSGALVEAVNYEKNGSSTSQNKPITKQPRIIVSPIILGKLNDTKIHNAFYQYYVDGLIRDLDGEVFINPLFNMTTSSTTFDNTMRVLNSSGDDYINIISPIMDNAIQLIKSFVNPNVEKQMLETITNVLNEKINEYCNHSFVLKYIWMKEFIEWIKNDKSSSRFSLHQVLFKEIVESW